MALKIHYSIVMAIITICLSLMSFSFKAYAHTKSHGIATYYTAPYKPSACYGNKEGVMIAAASDAFWNNGAACGKHYRVTCKSGKNKGSPNPCRGSGTVKEKIVDHCPAGCRGIIDLSREAFSAIADTDAGCKCSYQHDFSSFRGFVRRIGSSLVPMS